MAACFEGAPPKTLGRQVSLWISRLSKGVERERREWAENVQVGVKVDDADGTVGSCDAAEKRQGDGVVAAESDDSGECLAFE